MQQSAIDAEFPLQPDLIYLNHAAVSPWPRRTATAVKAFADENLVQGATDYPRWNGVLQGLREQAGALINAPSAEDIALLKNTSEGLSLVAAGLDWNDGDRVVGIAGEFPSNRVVWEALAPQGVEFVAVDINAVDDPEAALLAACNQRTRLLAISSVHFVTGLRLDLARLAAGCRQRGILISVDAIQSLGAEALDVQALDLDFVMADGHKWMLAPEALALFYCRPALRESLTLHQYGWFMVEHHMDFDRQDWQPAASARRFECGTPNMLGVHALSASLGLLQEVGLDEVERRVLARSRYLMDAIRQAPGLELITPDDEGRYLGIVSFRPTDDVDGLAKHLWSHKVVCARRGAGIRFAPHFYTPFEILDRALQLARRDA